MLSQQPNRLAISRLRAAFANCLQSPFISALNSQQQPGEPGPFIEVKDIRIPDNIARARRTDEDERDVLGDERLEECLPGSAGGSGILISEVDYLNAMLAVQARKLSGESHRVPMSPGLPEIALTAIAALVRTPTGKLHHNGAAVAPIRVTAVVN